MSQTSAALRIHEHKRVQLIIGMEVLRPIRLASLSPLPQSECFTMPRLWSHIIEQLIKHSQHTCWASSSLACWGSNYVVALTESVRLMPINLAAYLCLCTLFGFALRGSALPVAMGAVGSTSIGAVLMSLAFLLRCSCSWSATINFH